MNILRNACSSLLLLFSATVLSQSALPTVADLEDSPPMRMAEAGNTTAQYILGSAFYAGEEVRQDYGEAVKWFRRAADQGHIDAQNSLGVMLMHGKGIKHDYAEAVKWFRLSAEQENPIAQSNLGSMYAEGKGVAQSYAEAVKWYRSAAEQGYAGGQAGLGFMYAKGLGVERSFKESYFWLSLTTSTSDEYRKYRDIAAGFLTPEQLLHVQRRTSNWQPIKSRKNYRSP